ncbi:MAG: hypothetical protein JNJ77_14315 [Planctomycetia bacterium]|nr:hypothetical protein [Planctomycetia bacterium]
MPEWENKTLDDDFELNGHWWIPGQEDKALPGVLTRKAGNSNLTLFGAFSSFYELGTIKRLNPPGPLPIILGRATDGTKITLYKARLTSNITPFGGSTATGEEKYHPSYVFIGGHYENPEQLTFVSMSISITNIETWVGYYPIPRFLERDKADPRKILIQGRAMDDIVFPIPSIGSTLALIGDVSYKGNALKKGTLTQVMRFELIPEKPQSFDWFTDQRYYLLQFITFLMGIPAFNRNLHFAGVERDNGYGDTTNDELSVFYDPARSITNPSETVSDLDMLLPFGNLAGRFGEFVAAWFANKGRFDDVWALFFGTVYNRSFSLEYRFSRLANCLECYSRMMDLPPSKSSGIFAVPKGWKHFTRSMNLPTVPGSKKKISLRQRLLAILHSLQLETVRLISSTPEVLCAKLVKARDYHSHYAEEMKGDDLTGTPMFVFCERLHILIVILLLKSIGIDEADIRVIIENNQRIMMIRHSYFDNDM